MAHELAHSHVTVNAIAPGNISTDMLHNDMLYTLMRPDLEHPTKEDVAGVMASLHVQPVPWLEAEEITAAVVFLCSDGARHITGSVIDVDAGTVIRDATLELAGHLPRHGGLLGSHQVHRPGLLRHVGRPFTGHRSGVRLHLDGRRAAPAGWRQGC